MKDSQHKPLIIVISGPTGAGKTVVVERLLRNRRSLAFVPGTTTRPQTARKKGDRALNFVSVKKFAQLKRNGKFLETARTHGYWYGTLRSSVDDIITQGKTPILNIDVKGHAALRKLGHYRMCSAFITADLATLKRRIIEREPSIAAERVTTRLATARTEIARKTEYDAVILNRQGYLADTVRRVGAWIDKCKHLG